MKTTISILLQVAVSFGFVERKNLITYHIPSEVITIIGEENLTIYM